jgi:hypothetical protein
MLNLYSAHLKLINQLHTTLNAKIQKNIGEAKAYFCIKCYYSPMCLIFKTEQCMQN